MTPDLRYQIFMTIHRRRSRNREGDQLTEVLERLVGRPMLPPPVQQFRANQYSGQGDIEYFISRFEEITDANEWGPGAALLHLRDSLKASAVDCGRVANVQAVYTASRAWFGLSPREARSCLSNLRNDFRMSLQEHAAEVERLVNITYGDLPPEHKGGMSLETSCNSLGYLPLQRHLPSLPTHCLEDAVRAGNEYLQIKPANDRGSTNVRQIEDEEKEKVINLTEKALTTLMKTMQLLVEKVGPLQNGSTRTAAKWATLRGIAPI